MDTAVKENDEQIIVNKKEKRAKRRKIVGKVIKIIILFAILGAIAYGLYKLFAKDDTQTEIMTGVVSINSIQSVVSGSGVTKAKNATSVTLSATGTVKQLNVSEGDMVNEGDLLYIIDSPTAYKDLETANENVSKRTEILKGYRDDLKTMQDELDDIYEEKTKNEDDRHIRAEFDGQLREVGKYEVGDYLSKGTQIAELIDDSRLKISFYFSYAYEKSVYLGQSAQVSIPSAMENVTGTVEEINMVRRVSDEGAKLFEAVVYCDNPGTLTEGMTVTAVLNADDGTPIYPYENSVTEFREKVKLYTKVDGEVEAVDLRNYMDVSKGTLLLQQESQDYADRIEQKKSDIKSMQETIKDSEKTLQEAVDTKEKAQKAIDDLNTYAPISGTVLSCSIAAGDEVESGRTTISIADTTVMLVDIQVDERNVMYVKPGMTCNVTQWGRNGQQTFMGTIDSVSLEGKYENGVSYFPAVVKVENPDGYLMSGMYVDYSVVAMQSDDCLTVPVQAVKYLEIGTCLFVKGEAPADSEINAEELGIEIPEGYYPVLVEVGLSDNTNAEILSGVNEGDEIFVQKLTTQGSSYSMMGW